MKLSQILKRMAKNDEELEYITASKHDDGWKVTTHGKNQKNRLFYETKKYKNFEIDIDYSDYEICKGASKFYGTQFNFIGFNVKVYDMTFDFNLNGEF